MWIIKDEVSHEIISANVHKEGNLFQLWVTRPNDKNLKLKESTDEKEITDYKQAIDYAIKHGECAFELN